MSQEDEHVFKMFASFGVMYRALNGRKQNGTNLIPELRINFKTVILMLQGLDMNCTKDELSRAFECIIQARLDSIYEVQAQISKAPISEDRLNSSLTAAKCVSECLKKITGSLRCIQDVQKVG